mmetsp:Transcript_18045/g.53646  ORF Transcript_18045/g.53646 Transcript_18045/m.53646 type:complete len:182 (+) Transcript_18045:139-684(+)
MFALRSSLRTAARAWRPSSRAWLSSEAAAVEPDAPPVAAAAPPPPAYEITRDALGRAYGTGRRKNASARVWVFPGDGTVTVNGKSLVEYFTRATHVDEIVKPFVATRTAATFDVKATVTGGGLSGQAGAVRHGLARALQAYDPAYRPALKAAGYLTRDSRMVERKKPGRKKARKAFQWVKR